MNSTNKTLLAILVIVIVAVLGYYLLNGPDRRSTGERIGDAVDTLPQGVGKAADQLGDRSPGQKVGDALHDAGHKVDNAVNGH